MAKVFSSKTLTFIAVMAALGNALSFVSIRLAPIVPSIPLGPVSVSLALDLSHVSTFIAALYGGPIIGGMTGLIGGLVAAFEFGFSQGNYISGFGVPIGKAMTGVVAGLLMAKLNVESKRVLAVVATVLSYIPEGIFTAYIFISLYPLFFQMPPAIATAIATQVLVKAVVEMIVMGILLGYIMGNQGLTKYIRGIFTYPYK